MGDSDSQRSLSDAVSEACSALAVYFLSVAEKVNIGELIVHGMMTAREAVEVYDLTPRTAQRYAKGVREGRALYSVAGRPRSIDEEGMDSIRHRVLRDPDIDESDIPPIIQTEYENTYKRRHRLAMDAIVDIPPIGKTTMYEYRCRVRDMILCRDGGESEFCH